VRATEVGGDLLPTAGVQRCGHEQVRLGVAQFGEGVGAQCEQRAGQRARGRVDGDQCHLIGHLPAGGAREVGDGPPGGVGLVEDEAQQAPPEFRARVPALRLRLVIALAGQRGQLVDVVEEHLGEAGHHSGGQVVAPAQPHDPPPGDPGTHVVGGQQVVQRPVRGRLLPAEPPAGVVEPFPGCGRVVHQVDEQSCRAVDAAPHGVAVGAVG
jgi:hypothetical protein